MSYYISVWSLSVSQCERFSYRKVLTFRRSPKHVRYLEVSVRAGFTLNLKKKLKTISHSSKGSGGVLWPFYELNSLYIYLFLTQRVPHTHTPTHAHARTYTLLFIYYFVIFIVRIWLNWYPFFIAWHSILAL